MPIDSQTTVAEAKKAYLDNASYAETGDALKARQFATAIRALLLLVPQSHASEETTVEFNLIVLRKELDDVNQWIRDHAPPPPTHTQPVAGTRSRTTIASFRDFRN